ncbi:MAG: UDP-glucose 4-epimerase GalE [Verrucomicrobiales bacterium]
MSKPKALLVTGGAGFIGSHTVRHLSEAGESIAVLDNLSAGHRGAILSDAIELYTADLDDGAALDTIFLKHDVEAVIHFAAHCYVGESVSEPVKYYRNNLAAPLALLDAMRAAGCRQFIFSSTCATYGDPVAMPMDESHPQQPINPYGWSKLMLERVLADCGRAWGLRSVCLRYFNACGSAPDGAIGEDHDPETHLIPNALRAALGTGPALTVFGDDYPTPDGTCIRDYIHVADLATAHAKALDYLRGGGASDAFNLGTGEGVSVRQIIDLAEQVSGKPVPHAIGPRRPGDPPELICAPGKAKRVLGWEAQYKDVRDSIQHTWDWMTGPHGGRYGE